MGELTPKSAKAKAARLRLIYNTTPEAQDAVRQEQGNKCPMCERPFPKFAAYQDHLHACCPRRLKKFCGKCNRGLLCYLCNKFLCGVVEKMCAGELPDNIHDPIQYVTNLLAYMKKWEAINRAKGCYEAKETKAAKVRRKQSSVRRRNAVVQRLVELRRKESGGDGVQRRGSGSEPARPSEADATGLRD